MRISSMLAKSRRETEESRSIASARRMHLYETDEQVLMVDEIEKDVKHTGK